MKQKLADILYILCTALFLPLAGCHDGVSDTGGAVDEGLFGAERCRAVFRIGQKDHSALSDEMMHTLRLVVVSADADTVAAVVEETGLGNVAETQCELTLQEGRYFVYSFVNFEVVQGDAAEAIRNLRRGDKVSIPRLEGSFVQLPAVSATDAALQLVHDGTLMLPMSGKQHIVLRRHNDLFFDLYVHRLMCRVDMTLRNPMGAKVGINSLRLGDFHVGAVNMMPPDGVDEPDGLPWLPAPTPVAQPLDYAALLNDDGYEQAVITLPSRYVNESLCEGGFTLEADITRSQNEGVQQPGVNERVVLQLPRTSLMRNSVLAVDVFLHRYLFDIVSIQANPPIGGYPPMVDRQADGFTCTFGFAGAFTVLTEMRRFSGSTGADGELVDVELVSMALEDGDGLFTKHPEYDPATGKLEGGRLGYNTGRAVITLNLKVKEPLYSGSSKVTEADRLMAVRITVLRQ